jgi:hypothetical protein
VPGDDNVRSVAASTAAKNKYVWYGKSALQIARDKGHLTVVQLFVSKSDAVAFEENL